MEKFVWCFPVELMSWCSIVDVGAGGPGFSPEPFREAGGPAHCIDTLGDCLVSTVTATILSMAFYGGCLVKESRVIEEVVKFAFELLSVVGSDGLDVFPRLSFPSSQLLL